MLSSLQIQRLFFLAFVAITLIAFYPGIMSTDSYDIYKEALTHSYSDHHPPLMGYLWHYLSLVWTGPALMFFISLGLLWAGIYLLAFKALQSKVLRYGAMLIPLTPWVAVYEGWVWKDNLFTFGYGVVAMVLAHHTLTKQKLSSFQILVLGTILFFCSAVKYQAIFILPVILTWFAFVQLTPKIFLAGLYGAGLAATMIGSIKGINHLLVTQQGTGSTHSWQYVKIYDLAGMSLHASQVLVPKFLWRAPSITVENLRKKYILTWDPLVRDPDSPLRATSSKEERDQLYQTWKQEVRRHPLAYLQHRTYVWGMGNLLCSPGDDWLFARLSYLASLSGPLKKIKVPTLMLLLSCFIWFLPFQLAFFPLALKARHFPESSRESIVLLFLAAMGCTLLLALFVFSLAGTPRYIYFTVYFFMLSVPFALHCLAVWAQHRGYQGIGQNFLKRILAR